MKKSRPKSSVPLELLTFLTGTERVGLGRLYVRAFASMHKSLQLVCADPDATAKGTKNDGSSALKSFDEWQEKTKADLLQDLSLKNPSEIFAPTALPTETSLVALPAQKKRDLLFHIIMILLSSQKYDSRSRTFLRHLSHSLRIPFFPDVVQVEIAVANELQQAARVGEELKEAGEKETKTREKTGRLSRNWTMGLGAVAGGLAIGITGGLAAPLIGAGFASVLGGVGLGATAGGAMIASLASSPVVIAALFGGYGAHMSKNHIGKRTKAVTDFEFKPIQPENRLHVTIGISGWLTNQKEVIEPWKVFDAAVGGGELYALQWELDALKDLGQALLAMLKAEAIGYAKREIIKRTVFASLMSALWPIGLLQVARLIDNPWSNGIALADKTGLVLADVLIHRAQGSRPVTLLGYSLGARVIFTCLLELERLGSYGLVENVVLLGTPATANVAEWKRVRRVVSGRVVNCYSEGDWVLAFLYRSFNIQWGVAGLQPIVLEDEKVKAGKSESSVAPSSLNASRAIDMSDSSDPISGIFNVDVGDQVSGHLKYRGLVGRLLQKAGIEGISDLEIRKQDEIVRSMTADMQSVPGELADAMNKVMDKVRPQQKDQPIK